MKKRFSKILGVGLTLALLTSLIVMAAPVSALTQPSVTVTDPTISKTTTHTLMFTMGKDLPYMLGATTGSTAAWSTTQVKYGSYSALLAYVSGGNAYVEFTPAAGTTVADLATITNTSWWYYASAANGPLLELRFTSANNVNPDGAGHVDITVNTAESSPAITTWTQETVTSGSTCIYFGNDPTDGTGFDNNVGNVTLAGVLASINAQAAMTDAIPDDTADDWQLTRVRVEIGWVAGARTCYIDDVTIAGTTYAIEPATITITFPTGTDASGITGVTVAATSGIGTDAFAAKDAAFTRPATSTVAQVMTIAVPGEIGAGAIVQVAVKGVKNPATVGNYTLTVATSAETTAVTSSAYSITAPTITALPGVVSVYNPAGVLMTQKQDITDAMGLVGEGYTIKIGPGTYTETTIATNFAKLTFVATGTVAETIINGDWTIDLASITIDGLTLKGTLTVTGDKVTIKNCALAKEVSTSPETLVIYSNTTESASSITNCTFDTTAGTVVDTAIDVNNKGLTVSGCSFTLDLGDKAVDIGANVTVKDCPSITGSGGIGVLATLGTATVSGCTFDGLATAFALDTGAVVTIKENTIKGSTGDAITIAQTSGATKATIISNDINTTAATKNAITLTSGVVAATNVFVVFNNITDNTLNISNADTTGTDILNATHNWWGAATGPVSTSISGLVNTSGYLSVAVAAKAVGIATDTPTSLTAKTTAGVDVTSDVAAGIIAACRYSANPAAVAPPYPALANGYFDVYVGTPGATTALITVKLYGAVTADTKAYAWNTLQGKWVECDSQGANTFGGFVYVTVKTATVPAIADLAGLPFVLVAIPPAAATLGNPDIVTPAGGASDVRLTPTFAWTPVDGAAGYYFELADNPMFVVPLAKLDGDLGRLIVTAYAHVTELDYSTAYYWRVKAVKGTIEGGDLAASAWVSNVFITKDEPVEPVPPIVIEPTPPAPVPIIEPIVEVIIPPATPMTPGWIYAIIAVGGVLVIGLVVLIVRTRRVA